MKLLKEDFVKVSDFAPDAETTRIAIQSKDKNTWFSRDIPGQHVGKEDAVLIQLVLDMIATEIDPTGAIAKANQELAETQSLLKETRDELKRSTDSSELNRELTMSNSGDIDELFERVIVLEQHAGIHEESEEEDEQTDKTSEEGTGGNHEEDNGGNNNG